MQLAREWVGQRRHILVYQIQKCARIVVCPNCLTSARLEDPRRRRDPGRTRPQVPGATGWQKTRRSSCCAVLSKLVSIDSLGDGMCRHPWLRAVLCLRVGRRSAAVRLVASGYAYRILGSKAAYNKSTSKLATT